MLQQECFNLLTQILCPRISHVRRTNVTNVVGQMRLGQQARQEMTQQRKLKTHPKARKNITSLLQHQRLLLLENAHVLQFSLPKSPESH